MSEKRYGAGVDPEDRFTALLVRWLHHDAPIEAARSQQSLIEHVRSVGRRQHDHGLARAEAIHFGQDLIERLLLLAVCIKNGSIANVQITGVSTQYPVSRIASLPSLVVKQQNANFNTISGATYSSQAFTQAVQQALTLAQSSGGPVTG